NNALTLELVLPTNTSHNNHIAAMIRGNVRGDDIVGSTSEPLDPQWRPRGGELGQEDIRVAGAGDRPRAEIDRAVEDAVPEEVAGRVDRNGGAVGAVEYSRATEVARPPEGARGGASRGGRADGRARRRLVAGVVDRREGVGIRRRGRHTRTAGRRGWRRHLRQESSVAIDIVALQPRAAGVGRGVPGEVDLAAAARRRR